MSRAKENAAPGVLRDGVDTQPQNHKGILA